MQILPMSVSPNSTHSPVASVGIDVSRDKLDVSLLSRDGQARQYQFANAVRGSRAIVSLLRKQGTDKTIPCVIESTGNYHLQSSLIITQAGFGVKVINPLITKKYQKSSIRNAKSDPIDARRLAQIGILESSLPAFKAKTSEIAARKLVMYLSHLERVKQQMAASLKQLKETRELLKTKVDLKPIEKALGLIQKQIEMINQSLCDRSPKRAKTIARECPGLSPEKMAVLAAYLAGKSFAHRDQLVAYVGLDVALRRSGKWAGREKLSKRGEPYLRKILFQIAWGLKQHNPIYKQYYERLYHEKNKHYTTALIAVARKFLRFLFACYFKETVLNNC